MASVRKSIIDTLNATFSESGMLSEVITYSSSSSVAAITSIDRSLANGSFLFLDVKDVYSRFIFVNNGRAVGFYKLPFGLEYLASEDVIGEDMLYDRSLGELAVINAHERAKAKKLSVLRELNGDDSSAVRDMESTLNLGREDGELDGGDAASFRTEALNAQNKIKIMQKRAPRKLPPYMQRPIPETKEGVVIENFRVFVKYALMLIRSNPILVAMGAPEFVSVNLPERFDFIFSAIAEETDNGIRFVRFSANEDIANNLELYGGLKSDSWHPSAIF